MKKSISLLLCVLFLLEAGLWAGIGGHDALYVGGTISAVKENTEGKVSNADEKTFVFEHKGERSLSPMPK